jgi:hypothetical protein
MKYDVFPIRKELESIQHRIPEINPAAVMAMLRILQTSTAIRDQIFVQLEQKHQLSEGKLSVMMVLYEHPGRRGAFRAGGQRRRVPGHHQRHAAPAAAG